MNPYTKVDETKFSEVVPEKVVVTELKELVEEKRLLDEEIVRHQNIKDISTARLNEAKDKKAFLVAKIADIKALGVKEEVVAQPVEEVI